MVYGLNCILLYTHIINMHIYTYTCRIHIDAMNKDERRLLLEKYTSHFIWKGCVCERELETEQNCNILTSTLMAINVVSFSFSRAAQPEAWGPSLPGTCSHSYIFSPTGLVSRLNRGSRGPLLPGSGFLYHILSLTHLISNSPISCLQRVI